MKHSHISPVGPNGYKIGIEPEGFSLYSPQESPLLSQVHGWIELSDGSIISTKDGKIASDFYKNTLLITGEKEGVEISWEITIDNELSALRIKLAVQNNSTKAVSIKRFVPMHFPQGLSHTSPDNETLFTIGWGTWSAPLFCKVSDLHIIQHHIYTPLVEPISQNAVPVSDVAHITTDMGETLLIGRITTGQYKSVVEVKNDSCEIIAWDSGEDVVVSQASSRISEEWLVFCGIERNEAMEIHAKEVAKKKQFKKVQTEKKYLVNCTWSYMFWPQSAQVIKESILATKKHGKELATSVFQLDDVGPFHLPWGDWYKLDTLLSPEFAEYTSEQIVYPGLTGYCRFIESRNMTPGAWMALGFVSELSELYKQITNNQQGKNSEWLVKDSNGEPIKEEHLWDEKVYKQYLLDITNPDVQTYLRSQLRIYKEAGIKYFKLDFLYTFSRGEKRFQSNLTSMEAYNLAISLFREELDGLMVLYSGGPFYATSGNGATRVGPDVLVANIKKDGTGLAPAWNPRDLNKWEGGSTRNSVNAVFVRAFVLSHLYDYLDPDSIVLGFKEEQTVLAAVRNMGRQSLVSIGVDLQAITEKEIKEIQLAIADGEVGKPVLFNEQGRPMVILRNVPDGKEITVINWEERVQTITFPKDIVELANESVGQELFTAEQIPLHDDVVLTNIPSHDSRILIVRNG